MRFFSILFLFLLWPLTALAGPNEARTALLGEWRRPYETSALKFTADGRCLVASKGDWTKPAAKCKWSLAGDVLTFDNVEGLCVKEQPKATFKIVVTKDALHFKLEGKDACDRRASIDGDTWVRIEKGRAWDAPVKEMDQLAFFNGDWNCEGHAKDSTDVAKSRAHAEPEWGGAWQQVRDEVIADGKPVDGVHGSWGWDPGARQFVRTFTSPKGYSETATSPGFVGDKLVWTGETHGRRTWKFRQTFVKKSDKQLEITYETTDGADAGSTYLESCSKL